MAYTITGDENKPSPDACYKAFLEADKEFINRCVDIMVMMPDWEFSTGARGEHDLALKLGIEIIYE